MAGGLLAGLQDELPENDLLARPGLSRPYGERHARYVTGLAHDFGSFYALTQARQSVCN